MTEQLSATIPDAYIPIDRRQALADGQEIPAQGDGAVLFADISGFTQLTGDLVRELGDQRGADEITRWLNLIYGALIARIHQYQGSVISFAGDAITCWFPNDDGLRALAAGSGMQVAIISLVKEFQIKLQIKIVIAAGPAFRYVVGDPKIQLIDLLAGDTISRVTSAEKSANPGDLLVSDQIVRKYQSFIVAGKSITTPKGDRYTLITGLNGVIPTSPWKAEIELPQEILSQWLLSPVYEKIRHGEERFLAELRLTVSLFLKFDGIDYDQDPGSGEKINRFICWVQECLAYHDGNLLQVIIGDKGDYLFIGFGALSAHEDDPSRAVAAALMLRQPPESLSFISNIQIGITLGRMLAGPYGSTQRRTYSMLGASANLAARLMEQAAPGQILITERVAIAAQKHFLFDPLGAFRFKGVEAAVSVFSLIDSRNISQNIRLNQTPLVGRVPELGLIIQYASQLNQVKHPEIILLSGEGGIGKTRLLSELVRQIRDQEITVLNSFGYEIENSTPYFGIRELFGQLFLADQFTTTELQQSISELVKEINPDWVRLVPLLNEILPLDLPDNELTAQMFGEIKAGNLQTLLIGLFRKLSDRKVFLIILDDAHWLDAASWAMLNELSDAIPHLGLIISYRPFSVDPPKDFVRLISANPVTEIKLTNFPRPDIEKLVCQVVGAEDLPADVLSLIFEKASGHPFFSEELAYALVASGMLVIEDGQCRLIRNQRDIERVAVPDSIQSAIASRLDRMTLPQQLTLKVASILGRLFVIRAIPEIHPTPPAGSVLSQELDAMTQMNLIALQVVEPELSYSFKQNIIHDVAYSMLSFTQRQELHQKAALWYETTYAPNLAQYYPQLGYHWRQAEDFIKAASYLEKAAFDAIAKGAYRDGIVFIQQTLTLEAQANIPARRKAILLMEMGIAHFKTGELEQATKQLQFGIRILRHQAPSYPIALVYNLLNQVLRQAAWRLRLKAAPVPTETEREVRLTLSRAYEYLAQSYFHHNKIFFSLDASLSGLNVAESAGQSPQLARAYGSLCITTGTMPIPGLAEVYARLALSQLSDEVRLDDRGRVLELIAVAWSGKGRWADVEQLCSQALGMANEIGDRFLMMENTCILAACLLPQGKLAESVRLREELYQIGLQDKVELVQGWALLQRAEISLMHRGYSKMLELLGAAGAVEHALGQPDRLWFHGLLAAAYTHLGDLKSAHESAIHTLALARQSLPTSFFVLEGYAGMVKAFTAVYSDEPRNRAYRKQTRLALKAFAQFAGSFPIGMPRFRYWRGKLAMQEGHHDKALKYWRAGLASATKLGMVYESQLLQDSISQQVNP